MAKRESLAYTDELLFRLTTIPTDHVQFRFDEFSDTLFMNLTPEPQPAISVYINAGWLVRVHRDSDEVVGIQIDNALSDANPFADLARDTVAMLQAGTTVRPQIFEEAIGHFSEAIPQLLCCV